MRTIQSKLCCVLAGGLLAATVASGAEGKRPFTADDLVRLHRISDPQVSPDGLQVVYVVRSTDMEADRGRTDLWTVPVAGGDARRLTTHEAGDFNPRFAADGKSLFFLSTRSGDSQVWRLPLAGGEAEQVTHLPLDVGNLVVSPNGRQLAFSMEVFEDCETLACTAERLEAGTDQKVSAKVYDQLFVRHWDQWKDGRRSHLFVLDVAGGMPRDVSGSLSADVPSKPFGGPEEVAFSPDGKWIVFTARVAGASEPWSTNFDLYRAPLDGSTAPENLTLHNQAWDTLPVFSADGRWLPYLAMKEPGYEADRFRVVLYDWQSGERRAPAADWDRSPGSMTFSTDGAALFLTAGDIGNVALFRMDLSSGEVERVFRHGHVRSPSVTETRVIFGLDDLNSPVDLFSTSLAGDDLLRLTSVNAAALAELELGSFEQFSFDGWNGETVWGYAVKPVGFEEGKKYPLAFLIHGGPQGSFDNDFHYRWNPQTYAGAGYASVMIDFHGSTGYGQAFTDSIGHDWGGKPLEDLQKGLAAALERFDWIDGSRACALGASYGGFMVNWIAGNWPDGFDCLVNHDGVFDHRSMYFETEELWFPEREHGGPYWSASESHERHNPAAHVDTWNTPMLVIHGALDFRVPETQGLAAFTALQRQGVPSRFIYFPDENHWVLKPNNSVYWHQEVLDWLDRYTGQSSSDDG